MEGELYVDDDECDPRNNYSTPSKKLADKKHTSMRNVSLTQLYDTIGKAMDSQLRE